MIRAILDWFDDAGNAALAAVTVSVVSALVSFASVVVAVIALRKSNRTQKRLLEIEEQREQDRVSETRKARLVAEIVREEFPLSPSSKRTFLEIENLGQSEAREIDVALDNGPATAHPTMLRRTEEIRHVGPQSSFRYTLAPDNATPLPKNVVIEWSDDSGERGRYESTLT